MLTLDFKGKEKTWFKKEHSREVTRTRSVYDHENKCWVDETYTDIEYYYLVHEGEHKIISMSFPLMKFPNGQLAQGQYSFPFSVQLPDWLPASFELATDVEEARMSVRFKLKAKFENTKLNHKIPLVIMKPLE